MKTFGYWRDLRQPKLWFAPHPKKYVDTSWDENERRIVAEYLDKCPRIVVVVMDTQCKICGKYLPLGHVTDRTWVWPISLAHYVREHSVRPPQDFLLNIRRNQFQPPVISLDEQERLGRKVMHLGLS